MAVKVGPWTRPRLLLRISPLYSKSRQPSQRSGLQKLALTLRKQQASECVSLLSTVIYHSYQCLYASWKTGSRFGTHQYILCSIKFRHVRVRCHTLLERSELSWKTADLVWLYHLYHVMWSPQLLGTVDWLSPSAGEGEQTMHKLYGGLSHDPQPLCRMKFKTATLEWHICMVSFYHI